MRALVCHHLSADRSGLRFEPDWPEPALPADGEVTVALNCAGLNYPDLLMLSGGYQFRPALPFIPSTEGCGTVVAAGAGAEAWLGTRVIVGARGGCFAERLTLPASAVRSVPDGLDDREAAAFTVGALTAWVGLMTRGRLVAGETVLVTGAGSGMGLAAVALAAHEGARVVAVASSPERLARAVAAGAHEGVLIERNAPRIDRRDIDLVFDPVGGALTIPVMRTLRRNGRYLIIGFVGGTEAVPLNRALLQEIEIMGVRAGEFARRDPAAGPRHIVAIDARASVLRPTIGAVAQLEDASHLFARMAAGEILGKAVVDLAAR